jgi:hypothetical protein
MRRAACTNPHQKLPRRSAGVVPGPSSAGVLSVAGCAAPAVQPDQGTEEVTRNPCTLVLRQIADGLYGVHTRSLSA